MTNTCLVTLRIYGNKIISAEAAQHLVEVLQQNDTYHYLLILKVLRKKHSVTTRSYQEQRT